MSAERVRKIREEEARRFDDALGSARMRALYRLDLMTEKIESIGYQTEGEIGSDDPLEAVRGALEHQPPFEEIIVSTLPSGLSRWLKMDLPNRVSRMADVPVVAVEAEP
jgi:hypothetical protein